MENLNRIIKLLEQYNNDLSFTRFNEKINNYSFINIYDSLTKEFIKELEKEVIKFRMNRTDIVLNYKLFDTLYKFLPYGKYTIRCKKHDGTDYIDATIELNNRSKKIIDKDGLWILLLDNKELINDIHKEMNDKGYL